MALCTKDFPCHVLFLKTTLVFWNKRYVLVYAVVESQGTLREHFVTRENASYIKVVEDECFFLCSKGHFSENEAIIFETYRIRVTMSPLKFDGIGFFTFLTTF